MISVSQAFTVFNIDQRDGLPDEIAASAIPPLPGQVEPRAEALIAATGAFSAQPHGKFCNRMKPGFRMRVLAHGRLA